MVFLLRAMSMTVFLHPVTVPRTLLWEVGLRPPAGLLSSSIPVCEAISAVKVRWAPLLLESIRVGPTVLLLENRNELRTEWVRAPLSLGVIRRRPLNMAVPRLKALRLRVKQLTP